MPRKKMCRRIGDLPGATMFKPRGIPAVKLETVELLADEAEAIRLADGEGMYQEAAARQMGVSRQTFGLIIKSARGKVADAIFGGKALVIVGPAEGDMHEDSSTNAGQ